jgi:dCMP deaminase
MSLIKDIYSIVSELNIRPNWDDYFMSIAILTSSRSNCSRLHVGCVIVSMDNIILSTGYNGFIAGGEHKSIIRDNHEQATIHAETNAVAFCSRRGTKILDSKIYITHFPCINCFKMLITSGIKIIHYMNDYKNDEIVYKLAKQNNIIINKIY